jgi:hypothetical protein
MAAPGLAVRASALGVLVAVGGCVEKAPGHAPRPFGDAAVFEPPDAGASDDADDSTDAGSGPDGGAAAWVGTWKYQSGSQGIACGNSISVVAVSGGLDIMVQGGGSTLTVREDGCAFLFDVKGWVASSEAGQSCSAWAIPTIPTWTLTMQPDGTLREKLAGRLYMNGEVCTISGGAVLVRQ